MLMYQLVANDPKIPMILFHNPNILDANGPEKLLFRLIENMEKFKKAGAWANKGHQKSTESLSIDDLTVEDEEIANLLLAGQEAVTGKSWNYFHDLILGK